MSQQELEKLKPQIEPFLSRLLALARLDLRFRIVPAAGRSYVRGTPDFVVEFDGEDVDLLLQRGGELLDALEHLCVEHLQLPSAERGGIAFDSHDYGTLRLEELRLTAAAAAEKVERTGRPLALNPMNSGERRVIHLALQENSSVRTESEGLGSNRKVVVYPAGKK